MPPRPGSRGGIPFCSDPVGTRSHVRVCAAQHAGSGLSVSRAINRAGLAACLLLVGSVGVQHAKAVGDTRTLTLHHVHTDEDLTITYKKNGQYDEEALKKINWIMRDWRKNEADRRWTAQEIDLLWEVYQEVGAKEPIQIICGYRSPATNEMLRGRSKSPASRATASTRSARPSTSTSPAFRSISSARPRCGCRAAASATIPTSGSPFVHLDVGNVRAWPRMTREQLVKLFPDGRTVHLPADGTPLPGYELARADIERGTTTAPSPRRRSGASWLRCSAATRTAEEVADGAICSRNRRRAARRERQVRIQEA